MASRMATSRTQVNRLLDPDNLRIQFDSLVRAASAMGKRVEIQLVDEPVAAVERARPVARAKVA
jgi:hypothetical protein